MEWLIRAGGDATNVTNYDCRGMQGKPGNKDIVIGVCFIMYGIAAELIYLVVLKVMVRKEHRRLSCYKIMIALGLYDMFAIALNSLLTGYFWIVGANYCMMPTLMFVTGAIALETFAGLWCGACMNCFMLVINRLLDLWNKDIMQMLFKGDRTYIALLLPTTYSLYFMFFTPPLLFNSDHTAWFFSSFVVNHDGDMFFNYPHTANNLLIVVITCLLYVQYARVLLRYHKSGTGGLTWGQKSVCFPFISRGFKIGESQFFMQSSSICMANLVAALIYVYMQFFATPSYFVLVGHICWQLGHGFPAFVYLFLNKTIQKEALLLLGIRRKSPVRSVSVVPSKTMQTEY
ncbi:unnamed protein product [Heligmosomoides polygyrus]|uniref:Uncharacterized protein n=1 Tax=Heligmosomoides polygyrus TaxID=6339 RepID=A0A183FTB9_HELPZ|nr:unnamed protein product [Heligmosomoides polygyrus]